jgi:hypothetical protein
MEWASRSLLSDHLEHRLPVRRPFCGTFRRLRFSFFLDEPNKRFDVWLPGQRATGSGL